MPNNVHKSAAVPFVNQKGERSMKRVKVPRYYAGKKPAYANDEEEEYYTTDEEDENFSDSEKGESDSSHHSSSEDELKPGPSSSYEQQLEQPDRSNHTDDDDDDDDDPRFRRLKQIETKSTVQIIQPIRPKQEDIKKFIIDDEDDEQEIRRRHALARRQKVEEPVGLQAVLGDINEQPDPSKPDIAGSVSSRRVETEDLLKDFVITGFRPKKATDKTEKEKEAEQQRLKDLMNKAKEEATLVLQVQQKVEEDIKRDKEREALAKGDIGAREMASVNTDDEDDELAYEEWKLREITRVLRDRTERARAKAH